MRNINKAIIVGHLGADPIQRETKKGTPVVQFPVATTHRIKVNEGEFNDETQWHQVVVWGKRGLACSQFLKKGNAVYVEGEMRSHQYEAKDGQSRMAFEVHADDVSFLSSKNKEASTTMNVPA